jgi:TolB-like protein
VKLEEIYGFICELRCRKVYRAAAAYAFAGWVIIQVVAIVFPVLVLPQWCLRAVVIAVLGGFPLVLALAWAFEVGPGGVRKTVGVPVDPTCPPAFMPSRRNVIALVLVGAAISVLCGYFLLSRSVASPLDKSIAVLPFENFSEDKENEHFAEGVHDDVLTSLAKIEDLKVISRTSVMQYRAKAHNIRAIAQELGVSVVLEGSVRRAGNRIRLIVQLIDAVHDRHIWAQEYDRDLTDVFAIQSALAQEIASQLKAKLSAKEVDRIKERPTPNKQAYELYLQAHAMYSRPEETLDTLQRAEQLYEKATELDPFFALAFARLAHIESWIYYLFDPTPDRVTKAKRAATEAMRLQPSLPECHLAAGYVAYYGDRDYECAWANLRSHAAVFLMIPASFWPLHQSSDGRASGSRP